MSPWVVRKLGWRTPLEWNFISPCLAISPPCMPICFGIDLIILLEEVGAFSIFISSFLASAVGAFSLLF